MIRTSLPTMARLASASLAIGLTSGACSTPTPAGSQGNGGSEENVPANAPATAESPVTSASGSRLKARYLKAADGTTHFLSWFDSKRNEECAFTVDAPDHYRCFPRMAGYALLVGYADAACTKPLLHVDNPMAIPMVPGGAVVAPAYALVSANVSFPTMPTVTTVYTVEKLHSGASFGKTNGRCVQFDGGGPLPWIAGTEIPVSEFVAAAVEQEK